MRKTVEAHAKPISTLVKTYVRQHSPSTAGLAWRTPHNERPSLGPHGPLGPHRHSHAAVSAHGPTHALRLLTRSWP
jgi:hypothetical protein